MQWWRRRVKFPEIEELIDCKKLETVNKYETKTSFPYEKINEFLFRGDSYVQTLGEESWCHRKVLNINENLRIS